MTAESFAGLLENALYWRLQRAFDNSLLSEVEVLAAFVGTPEEIGEEEKVSENIENSTVES